MKKILKKIKGLETCDSIASNKIWYLWLKGFDVSHRFLSLTRLVKNVKFIAIWSLLNWFGVKS